MHRTCEGYWGKPWAYCSPLDIAIANKLVHPIPAHCETIRGNIGIISGCSYNILQPRMVDIHRRIFKHTGSYTPQRTYTPPN